MHVESVRLIKKDSMLELEEFLGSPFLDNSQHCLQFIDAFLDNSGS